MISREGRHVAVRESVREGGGRPKDRDTRSLPQAS